MTFKFPYGTYQWIEVPCYITVHDEGQKKAWDAWILSQKIYFRQAEEHEKYMELWKAQFEVQPPLLWRISTPIIPFNAE